MRGRVKWLTVIVIATFVFEAGHTALAEDATPAASTPATELAAVDAFFLTAYGRAAQEVLPDEPPAFLVLPNRLVLYRGGVRREWPLIPPLFTELKTIAHVTLGLFAVLTPSNGGPLDADAVIELRRYQGLTTTARAAITQVALSPAQRTRQQQLLDASQALTERALADGRMSQADLTAFCRQVRPLIEDNVCEAVRAYLDELNRRMAEALPQLTTQERADYIVIVSGVHQARIDNSTMQYFNRLMHDPPVMSQRLMYAENIFDESGALRLLGMHRMDRRVGRAYFDDPNYMNRDLLAPAAAAYLPTMQLPPEVR